MKEFKTEVNENVKEIKKRGGRAIDAGTEMAESAEQIHKVLEGNKLRSLEDNHTMDGVKKGYRRSFEKEYKEKVEKAGDTVRKQGEQLRDTVGDELKNVRTGIGSLEKAGGITEIGREAAQEGRKKLEGSAADYEGKISETEKTLSETDKKIDSLRKKLNSSLES